MSLTQFLKHDPIRRKFLQTFPTLPPAPTPQPLLAPPRSTHSFLVGTAFDYLLRFYLKHLNPYAITTPWIAELALEGPLFPVELIERNLLPALKATIEHARYHYNTYLSTGQITDDLIADTLRLAKIDRIYREGKVPDDIGQIYNEDIADLRQLIALVNPQLFLASRTCVLNPNFGAASRLVRGADADLILDATLIDIKTTKNLIITQDYFYQLIGYFILAGLHSQYPITRLGIYFSRFGVLYTFEPPYINPDFVAWFVDQANALYHPNPGGTT